MRLLSDLYLKSSVGARPIIMYIIAIDADGTRERQENLDALFTLTNSDDLVVPEVVEASFQHYDYVLPLLEEDVEGSYRLTLRKLSKSMHVVDK